jgi:hypothetical protein
MLVISKPISKDLLAENLDASHDIQLTEVRAKRSNAHLGHFYPDPKSSTGQCYAVNSAALHFIPIDGDECDEASCRFWRKSLPRRSLGLGGPFSFTTRRLRATTPQANLQCVGSRTSMFLQNEANPKHFYTGRTNGLRQRLIRRNAPE